MPSISSLCQITPILLLPIPSWKYNISFPSFQSESEFAQSCPTLCDPMDCSLPGSSVHGILQARVLEWVAISFSRGSSQPRDRTQVSRTAGRRFTIWATREAPFQILTISTFPIAAKIILRILYNHSKFTFPITLTFTLSGLEWEIPILLFHSTKSIFLVRSSMFAIDKGKASSQNLCILDKLTPLFSCKHSFINSTLCLIDPITRHYFSLLSYHHGQNNHTIKLELWQ